MKYLFIGNRMNVLNEMLLLGLNVTVLPIPKTNNELIKNIANKEFNILVSNGCPYIIPVSKIRKTSQVFINIHPSLLPDLRGNSPIIGAIKSGRPMGVTCHLMDDGVDTGKVVAQIGFEPEDRGDLGLCYKLAFEAEAKVFIKALKRKFKPLVKQPTCGDPIYYSK